MSGLSPIMRIWPVAIQTSMFFLLDCTSFFLHSRRDDSHFPPFMSCLAGAGLGPRAEVGQSPRSCDVGSLPSLAAYPAASRCSQTGWLFISLQDKHENVSEDIWATLMILFDDDDGD